jgi:hypothetical protein
MPSRFEFTFQGQLKELDIPANGLYDMRFSLFDSSVGGKRIDTVERLDVPVTDGLFMVPLDFGPDPFEGKPLFIEIEVQADVAVPGTFATLEPRHQLTPTPYAIYASNAPWNGITGLPLGFADNLDNDTVANLFCANGQVPKFDGLQWRCAQDDTGGGSGLWLQLVDDIYNVNNGSVGIGTTTPAFELHVHKTVNSTANQPPSRVGMSWREALIGGGGDEEWMYFRVGGSQIVAPGRDGVHIVRKSDAKFHFSAQDDVDTGAPVPQMTITPNGHVGIGTTSPQAKLHIDNGTGASISSGGFIVTGDDNSLNVAIDNNEIMARDNGQPANLALNRIGGNVTVSAFGNGSIGVGTSTPEARVHVEGGSDVEPPGGGYVVIGETSATNVAFDNNEIMARNNGAPSTLYLNADGGEILCGGPLDIGYEIIVENGGSAAGVEAMCPVGKKVIGGGCQVGTSREFWINRPLRSGDGWKCAAFGDATSLVAYAICARVR